MKNRNQTEHFTYGWNCVQKNCELKSEERSINGTSNEIFGAF